MSTIRQNLVDQCGDEELLFMDGYDDCIVGVVERITQPPIVCYNIDKIIASLMKDGLNYEEAVEFFEFNQKGSWNGDRTPCFITIYKPSRKEKLEKLLK